MRPATSSPGVQLGSVAFRYVLARGNPSWMRAAQVPDSTAVEAALSPRESLAPKDGRRDPRLIRLEAILLLAREPLSSRKLSQYANLADGTEARTLVRLLNEHYDEVGRAFRVEEVAGGYLLMTRPQFAPWLRRLGHVPREVRLSTPALETLAVIAYRQPVLRAEVEAIRGVNCGEILRQLMERDLVRIGGRSEELGRPYLYATTRYFLQLFGLKNLEDLPRGGSFREFSAQKIQGSESPEPDIRLEHTDSEETPVKIADLTRRLKSTPLADSPEFGPAPVGASTRSMPRAQEDEDDEDDEDEEEDDDEDFDDEDEEVEEEFDDEEEDDEDLEEDEEEEDEEDEEFEDDDLEEADWEEVDDEEGDEEEEDEEEDDEEEDEDWDDDEDEEEDWEEEDDAE